MFFPQKLLQLIARNQEVLSQPVVEFCGKTLPFRFLRFDLPPGELLLDRLSLFSRVTSRR